ncbi:glycerate kinase [Thermotoga sp. Ku-13t]|uniref:glycerate kinase type-2 family protein n=1 Tax=Thermotoga sp. Ku-13t TaxID=1755813 RepID=UPI0013EBB5BB|nr:glycerate kinase [Thermotoga sp. Ku-13t]KAF2958883.1 glycerate kinase [Thermotoga sp. Ku-13t]
MNLRQDALTIVEETIRFVLPDVAVRKKLEELKLSNVVLVAIGKAAWRMAKAAKETLKEKIKKGIVITKYGHSEGEIENLEIYEAGHPIPDENTIKATERALEIVKSLNEKDVVLFLVSGGGSALFEKPKGSVTLQQLQNITDQLLKSGANIEEINAVRKHLSEVKGGRFAQKVQPAHVICLILSDVLSNRLDVIASGPAHPDASTCEDALRILEKYNIKVDENVLEELKEETPKELSNVESHIIADVKLACEKAVEVAKRFGYNATILTSSLDCEAREAGFFIGAIAREIVLHERPLKKPCTIVLGGETVVRVKGKGKGGRNQELALAAAIKIAGLENVVVCSVGTDGTDGPTDAAGGIVDGETVRRIKDAGFNPAELLEDNNSYEALKIAGDLLITGPTGTNVNDLMLILAR